MKAKTEEELKRPKYLASVIVINKKGKVLLGIRKEDGIATPPGGHAQDHETPSQAALRELYEESGIRAKEKDLIELPTIDTVHGHICHCYLLEVDKEDPITSLDPDKEVSKWNWYKDNELPKELEKDPRRFESVRNAFMKYHGIMKGGPGSGIVGHQTFKPTHSNVSSLADKLADPNPFKAHLNKLKTQSTFGNEKLKSGKPIYTNVDQAMAHGYTPQDYSEAANFNWDKMRSINEQINKIKSLGKTVPYEMKEISKFHERQFKSFHKMHDVVARRSAKVGEAIDAKKDLANQMANLNKKLIAKSVVMMGQQDAAEVDTGKFANEHNVNLDELSNRIYRAMEGYNYGDVPRSIEMGKGTLWLTKVDDGMYSGYVTLKNQDEMLDNAKVRIERMTIPSLSQFILAKEYDLPHPAVTGPSPGNNNMMTGGEMVLSEEPLMEADSMNTMDLEPLSESSNSPVVDEIPTIIQPPLMDRKLEILKLLEKLTS